MSKREVWMNALRLANLSGDSEEKLTEKSRTENLISLPTDHCRGGQENAFPTTLTISSS